METVRVINQTSGTTGVLTAEGGFAQWYTAGETLIKGNIVSINSSGKVVKSVVDVPDVIGVTYNAAASDGKVLVITSGIAECYFIGNSTAGHLARGFLTSDGASYVAGQVLSEAFLSPPFDSDKHFYEIGHVMQSRSGAGLAKVNLHFN